MADLPIYQQIARDIATRIVTKDFIVGDKISGRSVLASEYNVSPETIRRAINLLVDAGCVSVSHGQGVIIKSVSKAKDYLKTFSSMINAVALKEELECLREKRLEIDLKINDIIDKLLDLNTRFNYSDPMRRFEFTINDDSQLVNKTIKESGFYQKTQMTIIGVKKKDQFNLSPGPDCVLESGDILVIVGDIDRLEEVEKLIDVSN